MALLSQVTESKSTFEQVEVLELLRKLPRNANAENALKELTFENIPRDNLEVVVCTDAAFTISYDKSSQLGVICY